MAQIAARACQWLGVAMEIMSMFLSSTTLRMSCSNFGSLALPVLDFFHGVADDARIHVANGRDEGIEVLIAGEGIDVGHAPAAVAASADDGHAQLIVYLAFLGGLGLFGGVGLGDNARPGESGQNGGIVQEVAPIDDRIQWST